MARCILYECYRPGHVIVWTVRPPTLVLHGENEQVVPFANAGPQSAKLLKYPIFKSYPGYPHGMPTANADQINADLLALVRGSSDQAQKSASSPKRATAKA